MHAYANGIQLAYEIIGEEGEPLLLIMGIGCQLVHWPDAFCQQLVERGFQVIRFDNRDMGGSSRLDELGVPNARAGAVRSILGLQVRMAYSLADMARDARGLLEALGLESAHVVGISMGGMIAQELALLHPERVRSLTSLMSSAGPTFIPKPRAAQLFLAPAPRTRAEAQDRAKLVLRALKGSRFPQDEVYQRELSGRAWDRGANPRGFLRQLAAIQGSPARHARLRGLRVPTLVIHGSEDPLIPASAGRAVAQAVPGARFELVEGLGHLLPPGSWPILSEFIASHALTLSPS